MPGKKANPRSVGANTLSKIAESGEDSVVLAQRQRFAVAAQALRQYVGPLGWCECGHPRSEHDIYEIEDQEVSYCTNRKKGGCRCLWWDQRVRAYPNMLPTQKNGRWSTTDPPVPNFPKACLRNDCPHRQPGLAHAPISDACWDAHRVFKPDPGWYWITWDKDAIEGRVNAVLIEDEERIAAFKRGWDVHTINVCRTFGYPLPKNLVDPHGSMGDRDWRVAIGWGGKEDLRRRLLKVVMYGTFYGPDENAILGAKGIEELDISRSELLAKTKAYLDAQPLLQRTKEKRWDQYIRNPEARTFWGRRLRCFPTYTEKVVWIKSLKAYHAGNGPMRPGDAQKVLWNFEHSAFVADLINSTIIKIKRRWSECRLVLNKHDSLTVAFPNTSNPWPEIRTIDEVTVTWPNGLSMPFTSTWHRVDPDGSVANLR
jgi:hypothetical protein